MENSLNEVELAGLERMRELNHEFLCSGEGSDSVRDFMTKVELNQDVMLTYLKGRKYRADHAWETLKRKAEVRFDEYPEVFVDEMPQSFFDGQERGLWGVLKNRDGLGRRILCFDGSKWDPKELTLEELTIQGVHFTERLLYDEDAMNNGIIIAQNCDGMGLAYSKQYTLHAMLRILHVFWYACPLPFKGMYFLNIPFYLMFIVEIIKPFFSKKLKERLFISTKSKKFELLHAAVSPDILPEFLGGKVSDEDSFDYSLIQ